MSAQSFTARLKLSAIAVALTLSLGACTSTTDKAESGITTQQAFSALTLSQAEYERMLSDADNDSRFPAMILLARSAIAARDYTTASGLISNMQSEAITPLQKDESLIIEGLLYSSQNRNTDALFAINKINVATLPNAVASFYYQVATRIETNLFNESKSSSHMLKATEYRIALLNLINPDAKQKVALQAVDALQLLPASELTVQLNKSTDPVMQGFFDFALLDSSNSEAIKQQLVKSWISKYGSKHPLSFAAEQMTNKGEVSKSDDPMAAPSAVSLKEGDKLAVLLPLSGRFAASVGEPARLGILAALQDRNSRLKVTFYDTNRFSMQEIASSLGQNGTNYIIGPILKPEVDALLETKISLPAIVFNQPATHREGMYYFNLGPDYEGALAASKIYHDGHSRPVVIAPESTRGQRAVAGFNEVWQVASSKSAVACRYQDINNIQMALATCPLNNADSVYINATASDVIKVRPSIPDNTPVYLTDRSFTGVNHSASEIALAGAYLGDMPWLLTDSILKSDLTATLPQADSQVQRIFAAAYDSVNFSFNLEKLAKDNNDVLHGITGDLQIGKEGLIEMAPMWVKLGTDRQIQ